MDSWPCRSIRRHPHFRRTTSKNEPDIPATLHVSVRRSAGVGKDTANSLFGAPIFRHSSANPPIARHCSMWQRNHRHTVRWIAADGNGGLSGAWRRRKQPDSKDRASTKKFLLAPKYTLNQYPTTNEPAALLSCHPKNCARPSARPAPIYASAPTMRRVQSRSWKFAFRPVRWRAVATAR